MELIFFKIKIAYIIIVHIFLSLKKKVIIISNFDIETIAKYEKTVNFKGKLLTLILLKWFYTSNITIFACVLTKKCYLKNWIS